MWNANKGDGVSNQQGTHQCDGEKECGEQDAESRFAIRPNCPLPLVGCDIVHVLLRPRVHKGDQDIYQPICKQNSNGNGKK